MNTEIIHSNGMCMAIATTHTVLIGTIQDAVDIIGNCSYQGAERIILYEGNLLPHFFDLKNGFAGDVLQKFSTYQMQLAIVGNFSKYTSNSLSHFINESNKHSRIRFVATLEEAKKL